MAGIAARMASSSRLTRQVDTYTGVILRRMNIARMIDHTLLRPDATRSEVLAVCREAKEFEFASVCTNSFWSPLVAKELAGSPVKVCAVVGFPLGAALTEAKVAEAQAALRAGAQEIDMVLNIGALKGREDSVVEEDIRAVVAVCHRAAALVKVILETALLSDDEKKRACLLAKAAGADFVKTSTGFGPSGATEYDVALMRQTVGNEMGVKASGGIRTREDADKMIRAGATRIGASASVKIVQSTSGEVASGY
jgi:deoxyribose-phosphate aldolase